MTYKLKSIMYLASLVLALAVYNNVVDTDATIQTTEMVTNIEDTSIIEALK